VWRWVGGKRGAERENGEEGGAEEPSASDAYGNRWEGWVEICLNQKIAV
jgi:hypothetical protein